MGSSTDPRTHTRYTILTGERIVQDADGSVRVGNCVLGADTLSALVDAGWIRSHRVPASEKLSDDFDDFGIDSWSMMMELIIDAGCSKKLLDLAEKRAR